MRFQSFGGPHSKDAKKRPLIKQALSNALIYSPNNRAALAVSRCFQPNPNHGP
jgi:hypothetical protein